MKNKAVQRTTGMIQNVFVLLLLAVFACLSTLLVTMGAQLYRNTVDSAEGNNTSRIMTAVVRSAVWAEDGGEILVEEFPEFGLKTLCVINEYDGERYFKRLYCAADEDSGVRYLYESYISEEGEFSPDSGESLCELETFDPSLENGVLTVSLKAADGTEKTIRMALRAGGGTQ